MLNGLSPIIIFNFSRLAPETQASIASIPVVSSIVSKIGLPPIPIYLSRELTGLVIDTEDKSIDIETSTETTTDGTPPVTNQKGISSTVSVSLIANKNSTGALLLAALFELVFSKVTSKEYSVTYLSGPVTIFNGLLQNFRMQQNAENTQLAVSFTLHKGDPGTQVKAPVAQVSKVAGTLPL